MAGTLKYFNGKLEKLSEEDQADIINTLDKALGISYDTPKEERRTALYTWLEIRAAIKAVSKIEFIDSLFSKSPEEIIKTISDSKERKLVVV